MKHKWLTPGLASLVSMYERGGKEKGHWESELLAGTLALVNEQQFFPKAESLNIYWHNFWFSLPRQSAARECLLRIEACSFLDQASNEPTARFVTAKKTIEEAEAATNPKATPLQYRLLATLYLPNQVFSEFSNDLIRLPLAITPYLSRMTASEKDCIWNCVAIRCPERESDYYYKEVIVYTAGRTIPLYVACKSITI